MKLTRDFQVDPDPLYTIPGEPVIQSAKFGRTQVDVWQDVDPGSIWRGEPKRIVGHFPALLWRYVVRGELSGVAATEAAAKSEGERRAWDSEANYRTVGWPPPYRHQQSPAAAAADHEAFYAIIAEVDRLYPADPAAWSDHA